TDRYVGAVRFLIRNKWVGLLGLAIVFIVTIFFFRITPTGFIPAEDQNFVILSFNLPPSSSLDRTDVVLKKVDSVLGSVQAVDSRGAISGLNILSGINSSAYGVGFIKLKEQRDRVPRRSIDQVVA